MNNREELYQFLVTKIIINIYDYNEFVAFTSTIMQIMKEVCKLHIKGDTMTEEGLKPLKDILGIIETFESSMADIKVH